MFPLCAVDTRWLCLYQLVLFLDDLEDKAVTIGIEKKPDSCLTSVVPGGRSR
jgi:hypothetical protein